MNIATENGNQLPEVVNVRRSRAWRNICFRKVFLVLYFFIFLYPLGITVGGEGVSANYSFILFPAIIALASGKIRLPSETFRNVIISYVFVFVLATIYQFSYFEYFERRVASFIIFMSVFTYMFIKIDSQMVQSFKLAIVAIAIYFSLNSASLYFSLGGADLGFAAKGAVGSQRFGFVLVLAIWLLLHYFPKNRFLSLSKSVGLAVLGVGLLLTFSRSGIVAIIGSLGLYTAYNILRWFKNPKWPKIEYIFAVAFFIFVLSIIVLFLYKYFALAFDFYLQRLFSVRQESGADAFDISDIETSEGYRVFMFNKIMEFITSNPFTGSGYLGVWILFGDLSGSAHDQYLDVLFRTGIVGFSAYVFLIYRLLRFLHLREPGLFWGLIGILIYGLVHETFKESQGAFILAFMLGMMAQHRSVKRRDVLVA